MLPPRLDRIRRFHENIADATRTDEQKALLNELNQLNNLLERERNNPQVRILTEQIENFTIRMTGPRPGVCPSCLRPL